MSTDNTEEGIEIQKAELYNSFIFNIINLSSFENYVRIISMGREERKQSDTDQYEWVCYKNVDHFSNDPVCIFQYTVSGEGALEIEKKTYRLKPGSIFMIERPGPFRYWLPEGSESWDFKFITFSINCLPIWNTLVQAFGRVFSMNESEHVMRLWNKLYSKAQNNQFVDIYENTFYAYNFLIDVHKYLAQYGTCTKNYEAVQKCIDYVKDNFTKDIGITDIAYAGDISPFYLNKTFKDFLGETPMHYVVKKRIRYSTELLYNTTFTIEVIAQMTGFQNANYFSKVFKKYVNMTPANFRDQQMLPIIL